MKIKLLKQVLIADHPGVKADDVFDISVERGEILIRCGDAELAESKASVVQARDPIVETRDPVIETGKRKTKP